MDRGPLYKITPEQWTIVENKLSNMSLENSLRFSGLQILSSLLANINNDSGIRLYNTDLLVGQRSFVPNTNIIIMNQGLQIPESRGVWEQNNLVIYYSLEESLSNLTVSEIKQKLIDMGSDIQSHRTKDEYIGVYLDSVIEDYDMTQFLDDVGDFTITGTVPQ